LVSTETGAFRDRVSGAVDGDHSVSVVFHGVFVGKSTGIDGGHLVAVESSGFFPVAGVGDATIFRKAAGVSIVD
jgi:hypothetical protein